MVMNIFGVLRTSAQGLNVQQVGLNVTAQNVANVNTEGYSRKMVVMSAMPGPPIGGGGVTVSGIKRYVDEFAQARLTKENSLLGSSDERSRIMAHVSELFNDLNGAGLGGAIDNFFGTLRLLQSSPSDATVRQEVLARSRELAATFNRVSREMETVRMNVDAVLKASAAEVNLLTSEIVKLNDAISMGIIKGQDVSDLQDQRDQHLLEIAEHIPVSHFVDKNGMMTLFVQGGPPLVEGVYRSELRVRDAATPGSSTVDYVSSNGQVTNITAFISGGRMGGALEVRDNVIPDVISRLDQLAFDLVSAVNAQHQAGFGLDGGTGRSLFEPIVGVEGAAQQMTLSADVSGNPSAIAAALDPVMLPGDNRNALALSALAEQMLAGAGNLTFNGEYANIVGRVGVETRRAFDEAELRKTTISYVKNIRDSSSGVSLDEEMSNLIRYQRAYQASAKVLNTVDSVLATLIGMGA